MQQENSKEQAFGQPAETELAQTKPIPKIVLGLITELKENIKSSYPMADAINSQWDRLLNFIERLEDQDVRNRVINRVMHEFPTGYDSAVLSKYGPKGMPEIKEKKQET